MVGKGCWLCGQEDDIPIIESDFYSMEIDDDGKNASLSNGARLKLTPK